MWQELVGLPRRRRFLARFSVPVTATASYHPGTAKPNVLGVKPKKLVLCFHVFVLSSHESKDCKGYQDRGVAKGNVQHWCQGIWLTMQTEAFCKRYEQGQ